MVVAGRARDRTRMRLWWNHLWQSDIYRRATAAERRMIEIRFSIAAALKAKRRQRGVTQHALAQEIGVTQMTISRVERASNRVSFDIAVRAFIALDCSDAEIASAFNPAENAGIRRLRSRASEGAFPKPGMNVVAGEHRYVRKKSK